MNYRSSISFHGKRLSWCPRPWHSCWNQPTLQGGFGPGCLNVPKPSLTGAQGNLCCSPSCLWPPQDLPLSLCSPPLPAMGGQAELHPLPHLSPKHQQGAFLYFLLLTSVRKEVEPVHEGKDERQHLRCSFSLNGRDSCSQ